MAVRSLINCSLEVSRPEMMGRGIEADRSVRRDLWQTHDPCVDRGCQGRYGIILALLLMHGCLTDMCAGVEGSLHRSRWCYACFGRGMWIEIVLCS